MKKIAYVMSQGHMDIEWYLPMHSYRFWLTDALGRQEDYANDGTAVPYTLDGQIFPLLEYLSVRPEKEHIIHELAKKELLKLGPFYTQFDEWIPDGEMMMRNCLYGLTEARRFTDSPLLEGYLPDNFGHPVQLPQILRNFNIRSLIFIRGMVSADKELPDEFIFRGADGSEITAIFFREGYARIYGKDFSVGPNHPQISPLFQSTPYTDDTISYSELLRAADITDPKAAAEDMIRSAHRISPNYPSGIIPIVVGSDHCPPQNGLLATVEIANELQNDINFVIASPKEYIDAVCHNSKDLPIVNEDLIGTKWSAVLLSALSSRTYLKRMNFAAEEALLRYAEPLHALAHRNGMRYEKEQLSEAMRLLMMNAAHDSIHGSSVDSVHDEMVSRYHAIRQISSGLAHASLEKLSECMDPSKGTPILTYTPVPGKTPRYASFWMPFDDDKDHSADLAIRTVSGKSLSFQIEPVPKVPENELGQPSALPYPWPNKRRVLLQVCSDNMIEPLYANTNGSSQIISDIQSGVNDDGQVWIENSFLKITARGALIDIYDKVSDTLYPGQNLLFEEAETGDPWDSSPTWIPTPEIVSSGCNADVKITEEGPLRASMDIRFDMQVPADISHRTIPERISMPVCAKISLYSQVRRCDVQLTVNNTAKDHKLSLWCASQIRCDHVRVQSIYGTFSRPLIPDRFDPHSAQPATRIYPFREWIAAEDENHGLAVACKGLYEFEPMSDRLRETAIMKITLLRGFDNMTRINTKMRQGVAAMSAPIPEAQCIGEQTFEYSFIPYDTAEGFSDNVEAWLHPPVAHVADFPKSGDIAPCTPYSWDPENIRFSCFKRAEDGNGYILRLWENEGKETNFELKLQGFTSAELTNGEEIVTEPLPIENNRVNLKVKPYGIVTLRLR